ncbi:MAG TPA: hypothetical protein VMK12_30380 [Anaeromyxobacteraceae bacterium]|nr:hypothetical protein [Anaeromyxobacteraceae bacterium]
MPSVVLLDYSTRAFCFLRFLAELDLAGELALLTRQLLRRAPDVRASDLLLGLIEANQAAPQREILNLLRDKSRGF